MTIEGKQILAYDTASREVDKAATLLESINVARFNSEDVKRLHDVLLQVKQLRAYLYKEANDAFLRARGFTE